MISKGEMRNLRNGLLFASPWLIGFLLLTVYSVVASLYYSFCRYNIVRPPMWIGLENYSELFFNDPHFYQSLYNTFYMMALGLPLGLGIAFVLALTLNANVKGQSVFRTLFYLPSIVPVVASSILWIWMLNPVYGLVNTVLSWFSIDGPGWLTSPQWSKPALILTGLWGVGNTMIIFLAGLQQVPRELYESALVDGAGRWNRVRHITIPVISPVIFFNLILGIIGSFQYFTQVYIMTAGSPEQGGQGGGPQGSTLVYALYLYQNAFQNFRMGYASAMAWILFVITVVVIIIVLKTSSWVHYSEE